MKDIQQQHDPRGIDVDQVGVRNLRYPIEVLDKAHKRQQTVATISLSANLPHRYKGTHMSRFVEILNRCRRDMTMHTLPDVLHEVNTHLESESARINIAFPYFIHKKAPVSGATGIMDYECRFIATMHRGEYDFILSVSAPVTSLCPCSKEISDYGAHNQRGTVTVQLRHEHSGDGTCQIVWIEDVIEYIETSASVPVYALLKRSDERQVTMQAYDNPVFVEDIVRNCAELLKKDTRIAWFQVHAENHESIHNHNAFAELEWSRR
jgi:GTP cyclohydrolase I